MSPRSSSHFCIVLEGMFTNPEVEIRWVGTAAEVENENKLPQIGLMFNEQFKLTTIISTLRIDLSPLLNKIAVGTAGLTVLGGGIPGLIGGIIVYNSIDKINLEQEIIDRINEKSSMIERYVKRMFERITDFGAVAFNCKLNPQDAPDGSDTLHIQYFNPSTARPPHPAVGLVGGALEVTSEVIEIASGEAMARPARAVTFVRSSPQHRAPYVKELIPVARETPGIMPPDFEVPNPGTLERLDDHDCIAIVMMENRSYDHFFHNLPVAYPSKGYQQPPPNYSNSAPGFKEPFWPIRNTSIGIGNSLIWPGGRMSDPYHNYEHTKFQIGGGTNETIGTGQMQGFAADFAKQSDSPQIVMSYLDIDDLPVYKALAEYYPVCDRWFAALPVGTWPNRLAPFQGNVPFLHNLHMGDPALGYLEDYSIFDLLNSQGISWKFFESDIGTIRLYDRFRLDVSNVRPFRALDETLRQAGSGGSLPRVLFIEPQFLFGNDDHPPMNVQQGQKFIRSVVGKFIEHGLLDRTLFVITYDEHGGFFDHVAPPGTPSDATNYGEVESLYPQDPDLAPTCLGVRVPSLVLSKWASARAHHTVLDHTAILKTILLHNRDKISTAQFGRFGERVKKRGHLGQVLDLQNPRVINYANLRIDIGYSADSSQTSLNIVGASRSMGMTSEHLANVLRGITLPRARIIAERD